MKKLSRPLYKDRVPAELAHPEGWLYYDIETSGLKPQSSDILSFGWYKNGVSKCIYNRDGVPTPETIAINGIDQDLLAQVGIPEAEFNAQVLEVFKAHAGGVVCGYNNCNFDDQFLRQRVGIKFEDHIGLCFGLDLMQVVMDNRVLGFWPGKKRLVDAYRIICGMKPEAAHGAAIDAKLCWGLASALHAQGLLKPFVEGQDKQALAEALAILNNGELMAVWRRVEQAQAVVKAQPTGTYGDWAVTVKVTTINKRTIPKDFDIPSSWITQYDKTERKLTYGPTGPDTEEGDDD